MGYYLTKIAITTILIVVISELAKKSSFTAGLLASIPLISVLAMFWLYIDTKDSGKVMELASTVFWLLIPSLALFISLPIFLKNGINFYISISISILITIFCYWGMIVILNHYGIDL